MTVGPISRFGNPAPPRLSMVSLGGGSGGGATVANRAVDGYNPALNGFLAAVSDPEGLNSQAVLVAGNLVMVAIPIDTAVTIATFWYSITTAGATLTAAQNWVGLYGNRSVNTVNLLGLSADQSTNFAGSNVNRSAALTQQSGQSLAIPAGVTVWAAFLFNGTTSPTLQRYGSQSIAGNANLAAPALRSFVGATAQTTMPLTVDLTAGTVASPTWAALS